MSDRTIKLAALRGAVYLCESGCIFFLDNNPLKLVSTLDNNSLKNRSTAESD